MQDKNIKKLTKGLAVMNNKTKNLSAEKFEFVKDLLIVRAMTSTEVSKAFEAKFGDTARSARGYMQKVRKVLQDTQSDYLTYHSNVSLARYTDLYNKLYEEGRYKEAAEVQSKIDKLTGVDVKRIEINQNVNTTTVDANKLLSQLSPEMIAQLAAGLGGQKIIDITPEE